MPWSCDRSILRFRQCRYQGRCQREFGAVLLFHRSDRGWHLWLVDLREKPCHPRYFATQGHKAGPRTVSKTSEAIVLGELMRRSSHVLILALTCKALAAFTAEADARSPPPPRPFQLHYPTDAVSRLKDGRPPACTDHTSHRLRLDAEGIARFKTDGDSWQTPWSTRCARRWVCNRRCPACRFAAFSARSISFRQVVGVLQPERKAQRAVADAEFGARLVGQVLVRGRRRMGDQALGSRRDCWRSATTSSAFCEARTPLPCRP